MLPELLSHSKDLKALLDEGFEISTNQGYALMGHIPYLNNTGQICYGTLVSTLTTAGQITAKPDNHVIYFQGEFPCNKDGSPIKAIEYTSATQTVGNGIVVNFGFSNKLPRDFADYYEKFTSYYNVISGPARSLDNSVTGQTYKITESYEEPVFNYDDTNSNRAGICFLTRKLRHKKIGIIGMGGTGSYVLDLVAKTPVAEIHLYDGDEFYNHNAFRAPGAASIETLNGRPMKTDYFAAIYLSMHRNVISHPSYLSKDQLLNLADLDFVFLSVDAGPAKKDIIEALLASKTPFIDTGLGVTLGDDSLTGSIRVTTATENKTDHISKHISFSEDAEDDLYASNIQIAELNALNAVHAVIKWKQLCGFYQDLTNKHHMVYTMEVGDLIHED